MKNLKSSEMLYEVRLSYSDKSQNLIIDGDELPVALWLFFNPDNRGFIGEYAIRGKDIISIMPDRVETARQFTNWYEGWKPDIEGLKEINALIGRQVENYQEKIKNLLKETRDLDTLVSNSRKLLN